MRIRLAPLLIVPLLLFAGCLGGTTDAPAETNPTGTVEGTPVARANAIAAGEIAIETPVAYEGRITEYVCTFGNIRHACNPTINQGSNEYYEVKFEGEGRWIEGTVTLADGPMKPPRVDIFLLHREPGENWEYDFPNDPYASGSSPQAFSWNLSAYPGQEFAFYVFASHAFGTGTGLVGVSYASNSPFSVDVVVTSASLEH